MVVLPKTLFAQSMELEDGERQDEGVVSSWVDPHQLKKIDRVWQKDGRIFVMAKFPYTKQLIHDHHDLLYPSTVIQESAGLQIWSRGSTGGHDFDRT